MNDDTNLANEMLDTLLKRVSSFANSIVMCNELGVIPNKNINIKLDYLNILIHAYSNFRIFTDEQKNKLNIIYTKVLEL